MVDKQNRYKNFLSPFDLKGKTAVITGSAGLLGIEHAIAILDCNGKVVMTDVNKKNLLKAVNMLGKKYSTKIVSYVMDVTKPSSIDRVINNLRTSNTQIDILINNAAIDPSLSSKLLKNFETFELNQWNKEISVGLTGIFLCTQKFGSIIAQNKNGGVILNIASDLSIIAPDQRIYERKGLKKEKQHKKPITYSAIKHGVIGLTKYTATYWADRNVRCNAISPGGIDNNLNKNFKRKIQKLIPLKRMADKNEYRSAIQFLCSDASSYMTGQNLVIDGGRSIW